jgi:hypothetical protein
MEFSYNSAISSFIDFYKNCSEPVLKEVLGSIQSIFLYDTTNVEFVPNLASGNISVSENSYDYERTRQHVYKESYIKSFKEAYINNLKNSRQYTYDMNIYKYDKHNIIYETSYPENPCSDDTCECKDIIAQINQADIDYHNNDIRRYKSLYLRYNTQEEDEGEYYVPDDFLQVEEQEISDASEENDNDINKVVDKLNILYDKFYNIIEDDSLLAFLSSITQIEFEDDTCVEFKESMKEGTYQVHTLRMYDDIEMKASREGTCSGFEHGSEVGQKAGEKMGYEQSYREIQKFEEIQKRDTEMATKYHKGNPFYYSFLDAYNKYKKSEAEYKSDDIYNHVISSYYNNTYNKYTDISKLYELVYEGMFEYVNNCYYGIISHEIVSKIFNKKIGYDNKIGVRVKIVPSDKFVTVEISPNYETEYFEFKCSKKSFGEIMKEQYIKKIYDLGLCRDVSSIVYSFL